MKRLKIKDLPAGKAGLRLKIFFCRQADLKSYFLNPKSLFFTCLLSLACGILLPPTAFAEGSSIQIKPATLQIRAQAPADVKAPFTVTNTGSDLVTLRILLSRFRDSGDGLGKPLYTNPFMPSTTDDFLNNSHIMDGETVIDTISLGPKQAKQLTLAIPVLKENKSQDHYFSIILLTEPDNKAQQSVDDENTTSSQIKTAVALPVLISINQTNQKTGFLKTFSSPLFIQKGPVPFSVAVDNTGEHFITAKGVILITNMFGQTVGRIDIPETNILASSTRILTANRETTESNKNPKVFWNEDFLLGIYTATLSLSFSPEQSLYTQKVSFVSFPISAIIGLFIILLLAVFITLRIRRKMSQS